MSERLSLRRQILLRPLTLADDAALAAVIRGVLEEHELAVPGTAYFDPELDWLSSVYPAPQARYLVVERARRVVGGAGIAPLRDGPEGVCELQKMYLLPEVRGLGLALDLLEELMTFAREQGYRQCYLETAPPLAQATRLYERFGFTRGPKLGATGHDACELCYVLEL